MRMMKKIIRRKKVAGHEEFLMKVGLALRLTAFTEK
jgi:hypothetical protein